MMEIAETSMTTETARERFQTLLERHRGIVLKVTHTYSRHAEDRLDLSQEISVQAWKAFSAWDAARPFSTWLYRIALNVAISFARSAGHPARQALALDAVDVERGGEDEATREINDGLRTLYRCIAQLDPLNRALLLLYLDERSHREIADILGLSETNVATRIGRLKQRLREDINPTGN